ncbi:hypothetical protein WJX72_007208 [[Myrmecia] bisecta]|uniref:Major facilitator superfamily (MFS) profile domain-containing protein n=1 Tax=[Myrmecia] bisecta TaxID=41462 RepID=A0AAW1QRF1_9CHLO
MASTWQQQSLQGRLAAGSQRLAGSKLVTRLPVARRPAPAASVGASVQCKLPTPRFVGAERKPAAQHTMTGRCAASAAAADGDGAVQQYPEGFVRTRLITFAAMWTGYACFYLTRNSLTYVAPTMLHDAALGLNMTQIGGLTSILPLAYGMSKFVSGVLGSRTSPRVLLAGGLIATALVNIAFGTGSAYIWFCTFWAANGILQGLGAPACARMLTSWFPSKERGTYWGFWTASNNVGGFAAPFLAGSCAKHFGWRWGMFAPGLVGIAVGLVLLLLLKDSPESAGYPPVEVVKPKKSSATASDEKKPTMMESLVNECLKNPYVWLFAIIYFFVYVVRQGVSSWFIFYLIKEKGVDTAAAAMRVSGLELGGLVGSLSAGAISDYLVRNNKSGKGNVGLRVQVVMAYALATAGLLAVFAACPNVPTLQWLAVAAVGFALYGPQMLIGLCGAECVSPAAVGSCQGLLGWIAYLGAANAGVPLALIVQRYGWSTYFSTLIGACGVILLLLAPMTQLKSYVQRQGNAATA